MLSLLGNGKITNLGKTTELGETTALGRSNYEEISNDMVNVRCVHNNNSTDLNCASIRSLIHLITSTWQRPCRITRGPLAWGFDQGSWSEVHLYDIPYSMSFHTKRRFEPMSYRTGVK